MAVSNFCPIGTCDIATPVYVNVYWDTGNWDTDVAQSSADMTTARIDALTQSLINSRYFSALQQYSVTSVTFLSPSIVEPDCNSAPTNLDVAHSQLGAFATCVVTLHPELNNGNTILNVFLPPQSVPASNSNFCKKFNGEHDKYGSPVEVTFLPTNSQCNSSISELLATMSHEMVEAATDAVPASPTGWKVFAGDEVADQCQDMKAPGALFLFGSVQSYFSDSANACTTGFSTTPPSVASGSVCGTGSQMIFKLSGNFGPVPWDLAGLDNRATLYMSAAVTGSHQWNAGEYDGFPPDPVNFGNIVWTPGSSNSPDTIQINGFGASYGSTHLVGAGDIVTVSVFGTLNGQVAKQSFTAPNSASVTSFTVAPIYGQPYFVGDPANVSGVLVDTSGCGVETGPITLTSTDGPSALMPNSFAGPQAGFVATYTPPTTAGVKSVNVTGPVAASAQIQVHPYAASLSPGQGPVGGSQVVTVTGEGFSALPGQTTISVNNSAPINANILNTNTLTFQTPQSTLPSPGDGLVSVIVAVGGVSGTALDFNYIVPSKPYLDFTVSCNGRNQLVVNAYNPDGSMSTSPVQLTASYAAFQNPLGSYVNALTVLPGQVVYFVQNGPISAAPVADPSLTNTQSAPIVNPVQCVAGTLTKGTLLGLLSSNGEVLAPQTCAACGGQLGSVIWTNPTISQDYVAIAGSAEASALAERYVVQDVPTTTLGLYIRRNSYVATRLAGKEGSVQFVGKALSITEKGSAIDQQVKVDGNIIVSFSIPGWRRITEDYGIVHLVKNGDSTYWVEEAPTTSGRTGNSTRAEVSETGVYALALLRGAMFSLRR